MMDKFIEQLVTKDFDKKDRIKWICFVGLGMIIGSFLWKVFMNGATKARIEGNDSLFFTFMFLLILFIGLDIYLVIKLIKQLNLEFEYSYTNGILDIDIIKNRSKRIRIFEGVVSEFEVMAHIKDEGHLTMYSNLSIANYSSGKELKNTYVFVSTYKGKKRKFVIEPKEEMIKAMYTDLTPRRMFLNNN